MKKILVYFLISASMISGIQAQTATPWQGKKCAVVITYDDAIDQHLDNAVPLLDSLGLKATFYVTAFSTSMQRRMGEWKKLAENGHELGNHTLFHPCQGGAGREWVRQEYDLRNYTVQRIVDEARMTNLFLRLLDGKTKRTYAYTCGDMKIGDSLFIGPLKNDFVAARGVTSRLNTLGQTNLWNVDCYGVNGESGTQLIGWAKKAMETKSLLVVLFHGVGGGNGLDVSLPAHREFLQFLKQHESEIWIAPMVTVAEYIQTRQSGN
ncbi:MAG: polysaccharide deacetylase family protein [Chitinophagaceae bacterium]